MYKDSKQNPKRHFPKKFLSSQMVINLLVILLIALPRIYKLGHDIANKDAFHFKNWSYVFMKEFEQKNYEQLYVTVQPGVLTIYSNIIGFKTLHFAKNKLDLVTSADKNFEILLHTSQKVPKAIFSIALSFAIYIVIKRLYGSKTGLIFISLFALEPYLIGQTRVIQTDGLPPYLIFLSMLLLIYFSKVNKKQKKIRTESLLLIGMLIGLATIEKANSLVFLPVSMMFIYGSSRTRTKIYNTTLLVIAAIGTMVIAFPAFWGNPVFTIYRLTVGTYIQGIRGLDAENFTLAPSPHIKPKGFYFRFLYNTLSETVLLGAAIALGQTMKKYLVRINAKRFIVFNEIKLLVHPLFIAPLAYFLMHDIATKQGARYMTTLFPFFILAAAAGFAKLLNSKKTICLFIVGISILRGIQFSHLFPDFLLYKNPLSLDRNYDNSAVGWGSGRYKLGKFLENSYETTKTVYAGDHTTLYLYYQGEVLNKNKFRCQNSNTSKTYDQILFITEKPETRLCEHLELDTIYSISDNIVYYIYRDLAI